MQSATEYLYVRSLLLFILSCYWSQFYVDRLLPMLSVLGPGSLVMDAEAGTTPYHTSEYWPLHKWNTTWLHLRPLPGGWFYFEWFAIAHRSRPLYYNSRMLCIFFFINLTSKRETREKIGPSPKNAKCFLLSHAGALFLFCSLFLSLSQISLPFYGEYGCAHAENIS